MSVYPRPAALPPADTARLVVEASAGTGKTYFLEHRVADLVIAGATIDQILLVTFTEKATAELRTRIRALLGRIAASTETQTIGPGWHLDDAARARLTDARTAFDRAAIHTIHGFCQRILIEDAFAGRRLFDQQQVADDVAFADAFRLALREALANHPRPRALLKAYLASGRTVEQLGDLLLRCARADAAEIGPPHDDARLLAVAADVRARLAAGGDGTRIAAAPAKLRANSREAIAWRVDDLIAALAATPDDPAALFAMVFASRKDLAFLAGKRADSAYAAIAPLLDAIATLADAASSLEAECARVFLPEVMSRLDARKARRGQFDYQDMLRLVWKVLEGDRGPELAARLRARHPHAMIDEFQDTDPLQWSIFRRVWMPDDAANDAIDDAPRAGSPGSLTIVGDPKQAIYSFRGADVHTYLAARDEMKARGAVVRELADNHRSSAAMIGAFDKLFEEVPGQPFFTGDITYAPVRAAGAIALDDPHGAAGPVRVFDLVPPAPGVKTVADDVKAALANRVADEIHAILHDRPLAVRTRTPAGDETVAPVRARDIFVLTRSNAEASDAADALRARGVPCAHRQAEHLFHTREAADVADLLDAIAAPRDRQRRLRAWMTAFFAVPLAELGALADVPDAHPLVALLHDWRGLALARDYETLFARILDDSRLAERALVTGAGARTVGNVRHVFEILQGEVARSRGELHELVAQLRRWIAQGKLDRPDDSDVQRLDHDGDAVHVMTIHRAKGLEAAVVFVVGGGGKGPTDRVRVYHDGDRRVAYVGDPGHDAGAAIDREREQEDERLGYVALTRAKVRLYLWHGLGMSNGPYEPVHRALARLIGARTDGFEVEQVPVGAGERAPADAGDIAAIADVVEREWPDAAAPAAIARRGFEVTSYTKIAHAGADGARTADVDHRADAEVEPPAAATLSDDELPAGADTGVFLHDLLEHVDFAGAHGTTLDAWSARTDTVDLFETIARRHRIDARHLPHARDLVWKTLTREVELGEVALPPLCRAARVAREVEFAFPLPGELGFAKGFIDLLVAWDERVWVVDYKSNVLGELGQRAAEDEVKAHYDWQTRLYAIAAQRMLGARDEGELAARFGGLVFWFLRPQLLVARRPTWAELGRWHGALGELVAASRAGGEP